MPRQSASAKVQATIFKKCDRSNHKPGTNKACASGTCQHTCEPSAVKACPHKWTLRYSANGKQTEKSYATLKLAQDAQLKLHTAKLEQGRTFVDPKLADELFLPNAEAYIAGLKISPYTRAAYLGILRNHLAPVFGTRTLAYMATAQAADEVATLVNDTLEHHARQRRGVARMICVGAMDAAVRSGKVATHKLVGIKLTEGTHVSKRDTRADDEGEGLGFAFLTDAQVSALADGMTVTRATKTGRARTVALKGVGKVREFALLSDGREVTLLDDRGWASSAPLGEISLTQVVRNVYTAVLPDDAQETGEKHEWQRFEQRLREAGVAVTADELRTLPYRVILSVPCGIDRWQVE